jgi:hypothetical protein
MPIFRFRARTADSWLAGIGASGALLGSAFITLLILAGLVSFSSWPKVGQLFNGNGGNIAIDNVTVPAYRPPTSQAPNLTVLLGPGTILASAPRLAPAGAGPVSGGAPNGGTGEPSPPGNGGGPVTSPRPPQPPTPTGGSGGGGGNAVTRAVSGIGNNVESDTNALGDSLGGNSKPGVGGLVGGVGRTINDALQTLAGSH